MSKTPWTPGPWAARDERAEGGDFLIVRPAPDGGLIDTLWIARPCLQGTETEANARLIEAAPEMAEVLASWVEPWNGFDDAQTARRADPATLERIKATRALLARIRGETP